MASTIAAITTGTGGVVTTADSSGNLSLLSGATTVVAVTSAGATVTGALAATGAVTASTTLAVTGASTFTGAVTLTGGLNTPLAVLSGGTGVTTSTGTGAVVLGTSPTLVTPALGTPASGVLTNCSGTSTTLVAGVGVAQTWQVVTRTGGTTYTNSTTKPICVFFVCNAGVTIRVTVAGVNIVNYGVSPSYLPMFMFMVPPGATYLMSNTSASAVTELR
jgi:hypothetical protein